MNAVGAGENWPALGAQVRQAPPGARLAVYSRVARAVAGHLEAGTLPPGVQPLRIAVLRTFTAEPLVPALVAELAAWDLAAHVELGQLGNVAAEILDEGSFLYRGRFDVCLLLALAEQVVPELFDPSRSGPAEGALEEYLGQVRTLAGRFGGLVIVAGGAEPAALTAPLLQTHTPHSGRHAVAELNRRLAELSAAHANLFVLDVAALAAECGRRHFWSLRDWATSMQPFSAAGLEALARQIADVCLLALRTPVKCLVLDCDNTLWGGIVGEDGLGGIRLGESFPGICYQQFQRQLVELNRLGFLLALNSRNNEADVREVFEKHPGMVLRPEHIAAMRVNWQDKVTNLRELAEELNLGLDSFVFIDDSPFELEMVRQQLPQVRTLAVPEAVWELPRLLPDARLIDRLRVTAEDRRKARMYHEEQQRRQFARQAGSLEDYLRGLRIELTFEPFDPRLHLARAAQLTQKTNQFNLTTRRYSEAQLQALHDGGAQIFLASLRDRFGEYGRIALAIVEPQGADECRLTVFLMSCRVIGRGVEHSFLRLVQQRLRQAGRRRMHAEFIPTAKNAVCAEFLPSAGFVEVARDPQGRVSYVADLTGPLPGPAEWLEVRLPEGAWTSG